MLVWMWCYQRANCPSRKRPDVGRHRRWTPWITPTTKQKSKMKGRSTWVGTDYVSVMFVPQRTGQPSDISYVTQTRKPCSELEILHQNRLSLWSCFFMHCDMRDKTGQKVKVSSCQRKDFQLFPVLRGRWLMIYSHASSSFKTEGDIL
jgi:hypothetical protein